MEALQGLLPEAQCLVMDYFGSSSQFKALAIYPWQVWTTLVTKLNKRNSQPKAERTRFATGRGSHIPGCSDHVLWTRQRHSTSRTRLLGRFRWPRLSPCASAWLQLGKQSPQNIGSRMVGRPTSQDDESMCNKKLSSCAWPFALNHLVSLSDTFY